MKKFLYFTIILTLITAILYGFIQYRRKQFYDLSPKNEKYIKEVVFAKDSEGRGYSDRGKAIMEEDLQLFNNDLKMKSLYKKILINQRNLVLSKSQEEYIANFIVINKITHCMIDYRIANYRNVRFKKFFNEGAGMDFETEDMYPLMERIDRKYTKNLSSKQISHMLNARPSKEECKDYSNE